MTRRFWPIVESAQADYEHLREATLAGTPLIGALANRFEQRGLAGLIVSPTSQPLFEVNLIGAHRPPWTPHADPRLEALAAAFELLLAPDEHQAFDIRGVL